MTQRQFNEVVYPKPERRIYRCIQRLRQKPGILDDRNGSPVTPGRDKEDLLGPSHTDAKAHIERLEIILHRQPPAGSGRRKDFTEMCGVGWRRTMHTLPMYERRRGRYL